jgi:hypothetical protein
MSGIINCATSMTVCARGTGLDAENLSGFSSQGELFLLTSFFNRRVVGSNPTRGAKPFKHLQA